MINIYRTGTYYCADVDQEFDPCSHKELFNHNDLDFLFYDNEHKIVWTPILDEGIAYALNENELKQFFEYIHNALSNRTLEYLDYAQYAIKNGDRELFQKWYKELKTIEQEHKKIDKKEEEILAKYFHRS